MQTANSNLTAEVKAAILAQYPGIHSVSVKSGEFNKINIRARIYLPSGKQVRACCYSWRAAGSLDRFRARLEAQPELLQSALGSYCSC